MYARCPIGAGAAGGAPEGALEARRAVRGLPAGGKREGVGRGRKGSARYVLLICVVYISSLIRETYGAHRILCCSGQPKCCHGSAPSIPRRRANEHNDKDSVYVPCAPIMAEGRCELNS